MIACIEEQNVIDRILAHRRQKKLIVPAWPFSHCWQRRVAPFKETQSVAVDQELWRPVKMQKILTSFYNAIRKKYTIPAAQSA